jgi:hypothetical protein
MARANGKGQAYAAAAHKGTLIGGNNFTLQT